MAIDQSNFRSRASAAIRCQTQSKSEQYFTGDDSCILSNDPSFVLPRISVRVTAKTQDTVEIEVYS